MKALNMGWVCWKGTWGIRVIKGATEAWRLDIISCSGGSNEPNWEANPKARIATWALLFVFYFHARIWQREERGKWKGAIKQRQICQIGCFFFDTYFFPARPDLFFFSLSPNHYFQFCVQTQILPSLSLCLQCSQTSFESHNSFPVFRYTIPKKKSFSIHPNI